MNAGPSGFRGAPMTKGLLLVTLASSVVVQSSKSRWRPPLLVRALTHAFAFRAPGELLFGAALLYFYRLFERQWGSSKYGAFVAVTSGLAFALEAVAAAALEGARPASGPFPLVFANLAANFAALVPPLHQFTVFGFKMTDKAFIYLASVQLLLASPPRSALAGACGVLAGLAYRADVLGLQALRLPATLSDLLSNTLGRLLVGPAPPQQVFITPTAEQAAAAAAAQQGGGGPPRQQQRQFGGGGGGGARPVVEPSPEAVQQLVAMGFDEGSATQALRQAGGNVEAALQYLL